MIAAQMGLGKTEMSLKFIQNDLTIKRVLFVSTRRLQADDVLNKLGMHLPFQHYRYLAKGVDIKTVPFLIIQYEAPTTTARKVLEKKNIAQDVVGTTESTTAA